MKGSAQRVYVYRGDVERWSPRGFRWVRGYSANGPGGKPTYPWMTRREAQAEARADGVRAVFVEESLSDGAQKSSRKTTQGS